MTSDTKRKVVFWTTFPVAVVMAVVIAPVFLGWHLCELWWENLIGWSHT